MVAARGSSSSIKGMISSLKGMVTLTPPMPNALRPDTAWPAGDREGHVDRIDSQVRKRGVVHGGAQGVGHGPARMPKILVWPLIILNAQVKIQSDTGILPVKRKGWEACATKDGGQCPPYREAISQYSTPA